jgi:hypothetical protein
VDIYESLIPVRAKPEKQVVVLNEQDPDLQLVEPQLESSAKVASCR